MMLQSIDESSVEYCIMSYEPGITDDDRAWTGTDIAEAEAKLAELRRKYPHSPICFSVHTFFRPIKENV